MPQSNVITLATVPFPPTQTSIHCFRVNISHPYPLQKYSECFTCFPSRATIPESLFILCRLETIKGWFTMEIRTHASKFISCFLLLKGRIYQNSFPSRKTENYSGIKLVRPHFKPLQLSVTQHKTRCWLVKHSVNNNIKTSFTTVLQEKLHVCTKHAPPMHTANAPVPTHSSLPSREQKHSY